MAVTYFQSEDVGAPQFTSSGSAGAYQTNIIEIMDAILVTGYGSKPGMGWTKEMTSELEGSDRTVYKNKSAHQDDMNLLVQSEPAHYRAVKMQIADIVSTPEDFAGYSQVACFYHYNNYGKFNWKAIGDERTLILIFWHSYLTQQSNGTLDSFRPIALYIGDFNQFHDNENAKCWGLIAPSMFKGSLNTVSSAGTNKSSFLYNNQQTPITKQFRPVTQMPEEDWSEESVFGYMSAAFCTGMEGSYQENFITSMEEFQQRASLKTPWFIVLGMRHVYQLRGLYNIMPWLNHTGENGKSNVLNPLTIDGINYIATKQDQNDGNYSPMAFYIQTSGEW